MIKNMRYIEETTGLQTQMNQLNFSGRINPNCTHTNIK